MVIALWRSGKVIPVPISLAISAVAISAVLLITGAFMGLSTLVLCGSMDEYPQTAASALFSTAMIDITTHLKKSIAVADEIQYITASYNISLPTEVARQFPDSDVELSSYDVGTPLNRARLQRTENISKILRTFEDRSTGSTFGLFRMLLLNAVKNSNLLSSNAQIGFADGSVQAVTGGSSVENAYMFLIPSKRIGRELTYNAVMQERLPTNSGEYTSVALYVDREVNISLYNWYADVAPIPMTKQWSDLTISRYPSIYLGAPLFDVTGRFIGVFNTALGLYRLNVLLSTGYRHGTDQFILSDNTVIASSLSDHWDRAFTYMSLPRGAALPPMCAYNYSEVFCLSTVKFFGYKPLQLAMSSIPDLPDESVPSENRDTSVNPPFLATIQGPDGTNIFVGYSKIDLQSSSMNMDWKLVTLLSNRQINNPRSHVWGLMVGVGLAITIVVVITLNFLIRAMLGPLSTISRNMTSSAYLHDWDSEEVHESTTDNKQEQTLSRWIEVRAIQEAYWSMSEELQALKAYIPEHLRDEVMAMHKTKKEADNAGSSLVGVDFTLLDRVGKPFQSQAAGTDRSTLSRDAQTCAISTMEAARPMGADINEVAMSEMESRYSRNEEITISYTQESFEDASVAAARAAVPANSHEHPIFFADNVLVDRDITMVHLNIVKFHNFARSHPGVTVSRDYEEFITFIYKEARRHGGILENFSGDKVWVSFNASSKCVNGPIAAAYFAYHVTSCINSAVIAKARHDSNLTGEEADEKREHYFEVAPYGITGGVATGRAFVGPLGNAAIKRHSIISNAMSEAAALERQALRYPGCNVLVGGDMIPAIEGYCQYILIDTTYLPGSDAKRRRIACLKGPMVDPKCEMEVVRRWLPAAEVVSTSNRFKTINEAMNAFLEGQYEVCRGFLVGAAHELQMPLVGESMFELEERKGSVFFILHLLNMLMEQGVDGRTFKSDYGTVHKPFQHPLCFSAIHPM